MTSISTVNPLLTMDDLIKKPENQYIERKSKHTKSSKIADELVGMLNADGGTLFFGVSDNGEIEDFSDIKDLDCYRKIHHELIEPPAYIKLEEIRIENKLIFIYHVQQEIERVFTRDKNGDCFLRIADSNKKLNRDEFKKLEYDKNIRLFEEELQNDFDFSDIDEDKLREYKEVTQFKGEPLDLLYKRGIVNRKKDGTYLFKKAAVLLFSKNPERYIPNASIRYVRYAGTDIKTGAEHNVIKDQRFEDNIIQVISESKNFLRASLKDYYYLDIQRGKFIKIPEYPEEAWLEGIVNAVCHRSYNMSGNPIYIKHFDDRIEISNSGPLPAQVTVENIKTERYARNPKIARVLEDFGFVRQLNEGVKRIYESMEKFKLADPTYIEKNNNVYLILKNNIQMREQAVPYDVMKLIEQNWNNYNETQQKLLSQIFQNGDQTLTDLVEQLQINKNTLRNYLNNFIKENILKRKSAKQRDINAKYGFAYAVSKN